MTPRVGIAGLGYFSQFHQDAWARLEQAGRCQVVAFADEDAGKRNRTAALFPAARGFVDAARLIAAADFDVLDIVTPPATHWTLVEQAAARKLAIVCQKPLAPTFAEALRIVEHAEAAGATLIVHENFRFMPWFAEIARLVAAGAVGRLLNITFRLRPGDGKGPDAYLARQPYFQTMPRFLIHETGIHLIDVFRFVAGEISGVFAKLVRYNPAIAGEDAGMVVFEFASGALGLFDGNRHVDHPADDTRMTNGVMMVEGTDGTIRLDGFGRLFLRTPGSVESEHAYTWEKRGFGGDCVYRQTAHILDHLIDGVPVANTGRAWLRNMAIEEAIYDANREGRFLAV